MTLGLSLACGVKGWCHKEAKKEIVKHKVLSKCFWVAHLVWLTVGWRQEMCYQVKTGVSSINRVLSGQLNTAGTYVKWHHDWVSDTARVGLVIGRVGRVPERQVKQTRHHAKNIYNNNIRSWAGLRFNGPFFMSKSRPGHGSICRATERGSEGKVREIYSPYSPTQYFWLENQ